MDEAALARKKHADYVRAWYHRDREKRTAYQREYHGSKRLLDSIPYRWHSTKARAKKKGIEFSLTLEELRSIDAPSHCPVLGVEINWKGGKIGPCSASLDRIDPAKGYVLGNVWWISNRANYVKNDGTAEEHEKIALLMRTLMNQP